MVVLYVKKFNLDYKGKRYKAGDFVQMEEVEAKKLVSTAPDEFEIIQDANIVIEKPKEIKSELEQEHDIEENEDITELPSVDPTSAMKKGKK